MARIEILTSPANPLLKEIARASSRGSLTSDGLWVAEGFHLLEEALRSGLEVPVVLAAESVRVTVEKHVAGLPNTRTAVLPDDLFSRFATTETTQGAIALIRPPAWRIEQVLRGNSLVVVLDGIQDPGNAGSIIRAAEAFGATGAIFLRGSVTPHNPKTLRAAAGSLFRLPFVAGLDAALVRAALRQHKVDVYAAMPWTGAERRPEDIDFERRCALIIGSEGRGVSAELHAIATDIAVPTVAVESLNAATAASVLLYEARRQRVREIVHA